MLTALARAGNPEEIIKVILERSEGMRSFKSDLPSPVAHLVERIVQMGDEATLLDPAADRGETRDARNIQRDEVFKPIYRGNTQDNATSGDQTYKTLTRGGRGAKRSAGGGASQAMKLANKLQKLILLAESDRRAAQDHVRMSEAAPAGEGGSGPGAASTGAEQDANAMKVLQRDVLQAVMRELELNLLRNQGDPDGWF
jgi:hypothetical protein